jgi:hypothetical protein
LASAILISLLVLTGCGDNGAVKKIQEAINKNDYFTAKQIYEDAVEDASKAQIDKFNQTVSNMLVKELQKDFEKLEQDSSKDASFYHSLREIEEIGIDNETLTEKINSYKQELEMVDGVSKTESSSTEEADSTSADDEFEVRFNYERKITAEFLELIDLWANVNDGSENLNRLGYQQRGSAGTVLMLPRIPKHDLLTAVSFPLISAV